MKLTEYPPTIARCQHALLQHDAQIRASRELIETFLSSIDREIAFDSELKNEAQRKARRFERLAESEAYQSTSAQLAKLENDRAVHQIELDLLRATFSVLKLEQRERIARMESTIAA